MLDYFKVLNEGAEDLPEIKATEGPNMEEVKNLLEKREIIVDIRDIFAAKTEKLSPQQCLGRISAELVAACPPGYPVLIYGEKVTEAHLPFLVKCETIE